MCVVKTPKPVAVSQTEKDPQVLRNPYLDGINPLVAARRTGVSALRIDRNTSGAPVQRPPANTNGPSAPPTYTNLDPRAAYSAKDKKAAAFADAFPKSTLSLAINRKLTNKYAT